MGPLVKAGAKFIGKSALGGAVYYGAEKAYNKIFG